MTAVELDFERAKARHILYKTKLRSLLYGIEVNEGPVISHLECSLGKWIHDHALKAYGHLPEVHELDQLHFQIHETGNELIGLYKSGFVSEARTGLYRIESYAVQLLDLLSRIEAKVREKGLAEGSAHASEVQINYGELVELGAALQELDKRIREQTEKTEEITRKAQENEAHFRDILRQAPVGIGILKGAGMVVEMANETYCSIVDRTEEELLGKSVYDVLPEVRSDVAPILSEVLASGKPFYGNEFELTLRRFGAPQRAFFNFVYQPLIEDGKVTGIIVIATEVTAQILAKEAVQASENQFRNVVQQSQFAKAILTGENYVVSMANDSMLKMWRRTLEEVEGKVLFELFPELNNQAFPEILRRVFTTGIAYREKEAIGFIDGPGGIRKHYVDFQYAPLFDVYGKVSGIMVSANDVTETVMFRHQIAEAAERLKMATEGTRLATWDLNIQTRQIIHSPRLAEIFGFGEDKVLTHPEMRAMVHPDDVHSIVEKAFAEALETGIYRYEARILHTDQSVHWIRTQGKILFNDGHQPMRMLGTMMDITEEKRSELALRTSEDKFRALAEFMPQLVWTADPDGNVNYCNQSVIRFTGLAAAELTVEGWLSIVCPEDQLNYAEHWDEALRTGEDFLLEHRFKRADGIFRWVSSRATPQKNADGKIQMWVGTTTDIHDSKLFIDQLESMVQQRTQELTVANKELLRTNMELAQFAYVASHDLQEPLRKIQTFATRVMDTEYENLTERGKDYFRRMQSSSMRMQQLIIDLLAFSRATSAEKHFEEADLNIVLHNVQEQMSELIRQNGATIIAEKLPVRPVIVYQVEQLFTNLITNAIKFTRPEAAPVIQIRTGEISGDMIALDESDPAARYQYVSFADNGIGFDQQFKDRIFQVFQRLHSRGTYEGTGIGLAICKKIVENHRGLIDAVGKPGIGSTFIIYFPL
ncbi:PAS domain S-box protein [Dyadobacter sandarakinus]|uniref:histidine kinase n=1 Tax=Dyadobacter sandarakinus TaxID=2747268 RepID=A0ABX7I5P3_9BACT|nr:PAS domain S-box protein [Dyadobacter sandarakinus]QRR01105.1 PAS domain S-box protein [Dyadobacter sandarakinus]